MADVIHTLIILITTFPKRSLSHCHMVVPGINESNYLEILYSL